MKRLLLYLYALLAILLLIFLIQNAEPVNLNFLFWSFTTRRAFLVLLILLLGLFGGWTLGRWGKRRRTKEIPAAAPAPPPAEGATTAAAPPASGDSA